MFFLVSKILSFLTTPVFWIIILLSLAVFVRNPGKRKMFLLATFILLLIFTNPFVFNKVSGMWRVDTVTQSEIKDYEFGVVLSGMIAYDEKEDRVIFNSNVNRITQAIELYRKEKIRKIFISGGSGSLSYSEMSESAILKRYLVRVFEIPERVIFIEDRSNNTYENALYTKELLLEKGLEEHPLLLITSDLHMRRSKLCFSKVGLQVDMYSVGRNNEREKYLPANLFVPQAETLFYWNSLLHEIIGVLVYKIVGYA